MKNSHLAIALGGTLAAFAASASAETYGDVARVLSATPIYDRAIEHRRDCTHESVSTIEERRYVRPAEEPRARTDGPGAGAVLGAIVGGVIGHQFGNSSGGRDHGTAAGAVIGGLIGNSIEKDAQGYQPAGREVMVERVPVTRDVPRCNDIADARERVVGYDVRYEYNGREFRARLPYEPGPEIPVNVDVRLPGERGFGPARPQYRGPY